MKKKKRIIDNKKGFTLVEVLLAIVLLGLVATPIFQMIYSGMALNNKSRKMLGASDLCEATLEFVSSKAFEDYKYTVPVAAPATPTETTVEGLRGYYYGADGTVNLSSLKLSSTGEVYPGGPKGSYASLNENGSGIGLNRRLKISNVDYNGYKYDVFIITIKDIPNYDSTKTYKFFNYKVTVEVHDAGESESLCSASAYIINSYK